MKIFSEELVEEAARVNHVADLSHATIGETLLVAQYLEQKTGIPFIRMDQGSPGLPANRYGIEAEKRALDSGIGAQYPAAAGIKELKEAASEFVKAFMDVEVSPRACLPTVGSVAGSFGSFIACCQRDKTKSKVLFIDPGFPVQKQQCRVLDIPMKTFDVYEYRGDKLRDKLEEELKDGDVACLIYSSPNNPAWFCFTDYELRIIGEMANKYGVVVLEDAAYFLMDFRKDYSVPGQAPFQPTVAKYTDKYVLMISGSKSFSYAGERIAMMVCSPALFNMECPDLARYYSQTQLGRALIFGTLYCLSSGTAHSVQYAMAAMLKGANDGTFNFVKDIKEYGEKAAIMKKMFTDNGFYIVYDQDMGEDISDGFYFTFCYPGYTGLDLLNELIRYGISAISLDITGSHKQGIRACVALVLRDQFPDLKERLEKFHADHPVK